jgi:carbonic anhydrase
MTKMAPLLGRNEQFARTYTPVALGLPAAQVLVVTCLDHRVDPAITLGLRLGDAPVIRNAGGRVTQAVIDDIAYLSFLAGQLSGGQLAEGRLFEVAVSHERCCALSIGRAASKSRWSLSVPGLSVPGRALIRRTTSGARKGMPCQ